VSYTQDGAIFVVVIMTARLASLRGRIDDIHQRWSVNTRVRQ